VQSAGVGAHGKPHTPAPQTWPSGQTLPQLPQFEGSDSIGTSVPPQLISQIAWMHCWLAPQAWPQVPQLEGSVARQGKLPPPQTERPVAHDGPKVQWVPGLVLSAEPPGGQESTHTPSSTPGAPGVQ
jgi:hypothetical protein